MILFRYILRNHAAPFLFSITTLMFIFLFQFLMKFADKLVGKGLDTWIVIQLIMYNLAWMVVLVVPMAVLVATLMAFGAMAQNNEITIMKSSGVSLYKMIAGPLAASAVVGVFLIFFNNDVLPDANHQAKILMMDIQQKKPTLSIEPGVFSQEVDNYAILARTMDQKGNKMHGVTIYDYTNPYKINIVTAKEGLLYFSKNQTKLLMDLQNGEIHESGVSDTKLYRKLLFTNHRIAMDAQQFSFQQSGPGVQRSDRELSAPDMLAIVDSLKQMRSKYFTSFQKTTHKFFLGDSFAAPLQGKIHQSYTPNDNYTNLIERVKNIKNEMLSSFLQVDFVDKEIDKYMVEVHKKYSIPAACIIFILLGAPLGVITRKGGFGMAASVSLFFFLIYWASLIGGEKLADRGFMTPFWGMWSANILMGLVGILLTKKVANETVTLDFSFFKKLIPKAWQEPEETTS
ncbi:MAG: LptF/LptG family permease [Ignavibacteriaceae bacterium]|nr:LptF/LptG family permease [Ignavibacteriaceae bacterium]